LEFASRKLNWFANFISDSAKIPISEDDLYRELLKWKDNRMTYKHFRQELDKYSVFTGRNVLVSKFFTHCYILLTIIYHRTSPDIGMIHH
jgi:hypothetical protein